MTFAARIRVLVAPGRGLTISDETTMPIDIDMGGRATWTLRAEKPDAHRATVLELRAGGCASEDDARLLGNAAKAALRYAGVAANVFMDIGPDRAPSGLFRGFRSRLEEKAGVQVRNDVHGLDVYQDDGRPIRFFSMAATPLQTAPIPRFLEFLDRGLDLALDPAVALSDKVEFAADLYLGSEFERSERARFVTFITVLEVLSRRKERPDWIQELLAAWRAEVQGLLEDETQPDVRKQVASLIGGLNELQKQSIGSAVRDLIKTKGQDEELQRIADDPIGFVSRCYDIRSRLMHDGRPPSDVDLAGVRGQLGLLVRSILVSELGR